jgi:monoamine oxidase
MDADVLVVGAGLAGLRAARDAAEAGRSVIVLEARDRVGGRGYSVELGGRVVELGGSWFTPEQTEVRAELERYGLPIRDFPEVLHARWLTDGVLRRGLPVPWEELGRLEAALTQISADAQALDPEITDLSASEYVERFSPSAALRDFLLGWYQLMAGSPPDRGAISDALYSIRDHGGLVGLITCLAHGPATGWSALAEALATGLDVRLRAPVISLGHTAGRVTAETAGGDLLTARAAVIAVPINCLGDIRFTPELPAPTAAAAGQNAGAAVKVLMLARGIEPHGIAVGIGPGLNWLYADTELQGETLVTGFGWEDPVFDPYDRTHVERALQAFFPSAELVDVRAHDWIADTASRGTWLTAPAGRSALIEPVRFRPLDALVFAGSDVSEHEAGWFEGALLSGAKAAEWLASVDYQ